MNRRDCTARRRRDTIVEKLNAGFFSNILQAVRQAIGMVQHGMVATAGGGTFCLRPGTICLHGDQPGALRFAIALRAALQQSGSEVKAP